MTMDQLRSAVAHRLYEQAYAPVRGWEEERVVADTWADLVCILGEEEAQVHAVSECVEMLEMHRACVEVDCV
jgi:hypothetical protein